MNRPALKYERLLNAIHEVYYCSDVHGNIIEVSPSIETVAGHHWRDVLGKPATVFYRYPKDCLRFIKMLKTQGFVEDHELELMHRDGHSIHVSANAHMLFDAQNNIIGAEGMLRDISDRVALEKKLSDLNDELELRVKQRTSELAEKNLQLQTLSQAIEQSAEGFIITDCSGRVNYVNQAFEHINGYSSNEIIGHTLSVLSSGKHNADFFHDIWNTIRAGRVWEGTIINRRKDGTDYPALMTIVPITMHGKIEFYSAIQQDISEQQALEAQFRQAQKMDAMGTLVGGIAHDFNNMLAGLLMHLYLAKQNINNTTKALATLDKAERLGYQASEIIKGLLIFSRDDETEMQTLAFNTILRDSIDMLKVSIPEHIQLKLNLCQQNISIAGNTTQLQQVLMNLLNNARDALKTNLQGQIDVDLDYFIIDQEFADQHPDLHEDAMLHLSVSDNGCGIPEAIIDKIFDPFFTTKAAGQGTGLGLAMVYGCIKNHQGILEVESNPAAGTTFHIYLPLIKDHFAAEETATNNHSHQGNGELILVADDNKIIRKLIVEALQMLNYQTIQAADGSEALRLFTEHQQEIKLAVLDMVMPCMSGREAARRIRMSMPELPIIFSTGHNKHDAMQEIESFERCTLHQKPFKITHLSQDILKLLN